MDGDSELPPLAGTDEVASPAGSKPSLKPSRSSTKKGKRISELQAKFEASFDSGRASNVDEKNKEVKRESSRRLTQHWETIRWLRENVVTTKEF